MLEGFKKINLTIGLPSISITENGIGFSKAAVVKMNKPSHVVLLIDEDNKRFAIQACAENDEDATPFYKNKKTVSVRINNRDFLNTISKMMDWDLKSQGYKVEGQYLSADNAMIFDLNDYTILSGAEKEDDD